MLEEVSKRQILVDPSTSKNPKLKEAAWEEVRNIVNVTFGLTLEREQIFYLYILYFIDLLLGTIAL